MGYIIMPEGARGVDELLGFSSDPYMQDWDIERADARKVGAWIELVKPSELTTEGKYAFFALIVASYDDALSDQGPGRDLKVEEWICEQARRYSGSYSDIINYWKSYSADEAGVGEVASVFDSC